MAAEQEETAEEGDERDRQEERRDEEGGGEGRGGGAGVGGGAPSGRATPRVKMISWYAGRESSALAKELYGGEVGQHATPDEVREATIENDANIRSPSALWLFLSPGLFLLGLSSGSKARPKPRSI